MKKSLAILFWAIVLIIAGFCIYRHLNWQTFTHEVYGYKISYPKTWLSNKEKSYVDGVNKILSVMVFYEETKKRSVSVEVAENDITTPLQKKAARTEPITISDATSTIYFFNSDAKSCQTLPENVCGYFLIPIKHNNLWYILGTDGTQADLENAREKIISSFKFTK